MPKTKISEFSSTPANNTDIDSINIAENCPPSGINDAIRELMAQLKDWQSGTSNDPYVVGSSGSLTLNQGTANTVPYLNGSKVVTSGSALSFDGSNLGLGVTPSASGSFMRVLQVGDSGSMGNNSGTMRYGNNFYIDSGGTSKYIRSSSNAHLYAQDANAGHIWSTAPSGTAGNAITFTQAMTLDASGNLGVGLTSPAARLHSEAGTGATNLRLSSATKSSVNIVAAREGVGYWPLDIDAERTQFLIQGVEKARIDSSGNLLVGVTSGGNSRIYAEGGSSYHSIRALANTAGNVAIYGVSSANSSTGYCAYFNNSGSGTGLFISNTAAWQSVSDSRLKDDVKNLDTTSKLLQLRPVDYVWKNQAESDEPVKRSMGFIAQEVQEVFPELVGVSPDGFFSVEYTGLISPLVKAIQEQQAIIESLKARLDAANL